MRIPDPTLIQANLAPAPVPAQPQPVAAPVPVTPPPKVGPDLLHLSANASALGGATGDDPETLRQMLVSGLLQLLAGDHVLTSEYSVAGQTPLAPAPTAAPSAASPDDGVADLRLRLPLVVMAADGSRMTMRAELALHPGLLRYVPALAAVLAESQLGTAPGVAVVQLPLPQLPPPQLLGFHLLLNPASLWPLSVTIASGQLRLVAADEPVDDDTDETDRRPVGARVRDWLELHRQRMAQR